MRRPRACRCSYFYPRPPRGGRRAFVPVGDVGCSISIHALREEGDSVYFQTVPSSSTFLSTPSARRATRPEWCEKILSGISIHALREEGDRSSSCTTHRPSDFYPRPPRGGRRYGYGKHKVWVIFLSTPSARRATAVSPSNTYKLTFLSTPSARRATTILARSMQRGEFLSTPSARRATAGDHQRGRAARYFYPRPPRGGRRKPTKRTTSNRRFLSTPSARRATIPMARVTPILPRFLSTPSARRATKEEVKRTSLLQISIHALREEGDVPMVAARKGPGSISIHALREEGDYPKQERRG